MPAVAAHDSRIGCYFPATEIGFKAIMAREFFGGQCICHRLMLHFPFNRPGRETVRLAMPLLVCACDSDTTTPPGPTIKAAHRAPGGELGRSYYGHSNIYHNPQVKTDHVDFLRRVVPESCRTAPAARTPIRGRPAGNRPIVG